MFAYSRLKIRVNGALAAAGVGVDLFVDLVRALSTGFSTIRVQILI